MWHKPCRTFHPWCLCIKTRCLADSVRPAEFTESQSLSALWTHRLFEWCALANAWTQALMSENVHRKHVCVDISVLADVSVPLNGGLPSQLSKFGFHIHTGVALAKFKEHLSQTSKVRILDSAEDDHMSLFDSKTACLCQSIKINNKHVNSQSQGPVSI